MRIRLSNIIVYLLAVSAVWAGNVAVQNFEAQSSCNYFDTYINVDYPVGDSSVVVPLREWMYSTLDCHAKIGIGENPIAPCFEKCNAKYAMLREDFDFYEEEYFNGGYDSTWVIYKSQTPSTITYEVQSSGYNFGAAHGWFNRPVYVFLKGHAKPLTYEDIFTTSRAEMIEYLSYLAGVEPSNQRGCGVRWGIEEIDQVYPSADGIVFLWHTYAVNCGACGNVDFVLPYERFHGMFRPEFEKVMKEIKWRYWWNVDFGVPMYWE